MNASLIASFVTKCVLQILEKQPKKVENGTEEEPQPYDNSYFFILFVMLFYSFLALTVFCGYMRSKKEVEKKDPYEEFMEDKDKEKKWRAAQTVEKFDFEEECIP